VDATVEPFQRHVAIREGLQLAVREWPGIERPFLLVHGLASNARTWDIVGQHLSERGHYVVAVDQRGHGHSDKPDSGYGFDEVTEDLDLLIERLELRRPVVAGQSWGGNVVLDFAVRHPHALSGLVLVDGGFIELSRDGETWDSVADRLKPPHLIGTPRSLMLERMRSFHAEWSETQIEMQMGNFETMPDGTIRPWLTLGHHMEIVRALYYQRPSQLFPKVTSPTLIAAAPGASAGRREAKHHEVEAAANSLERVRVRWFEDSGHDIHIERSEALVAWMLEALDERFFD